MVVEEQEEDKIISLDISKLGLWGMSHRPNDGPFYLGLGISPMSFCIFAPINC